MTGSFLKVAIRIFIKYRSYTLINIFALAIGLASSIIIFLYVENEYSFDRFHDKSRQIYRIGMEGVVSGNKLNHAITSAPLAPTLVKECPEIKKAVRIGRFGAWLVRYNNIRHNEDSLIFADSTFFEIFSFPLIEGDPENVLDQPESIVLSQKAARRYFGTEPALGKKLRIENDSTYYKVTGVMADIPANSHLHFDMVASLSTLYKYIWKDSWIINNFYTYILLDKNADMDSLSLKLSALVEKYVVPAYYKMLDMSSDEITSSDEDRYTFILQPLLDIHLKSDLEVEFQPGGNINYVYIFSAIAILILIVACINFMNLATASTANRATEVGIRKIAGSDKRILVRQFLMESFMITLLSLLIALLFVEMLLPLFNSYINLNLTLGQLATPTGFLLLFSLVAIVGVFAGLYPAFFLSSFDPIRVLRSWTKSGSRTSYLRTGLVFFQFFVTISILIMTFVVYAQFDFVIHKDLGFDKENLLVIRRPDGLRKDLEKYRKAILTHENVLTASNSLSLPGSIYTSSTFYLEGTSPEKNFHLIFQLVNYDFLKTYNLSLTEGRFFDPLVPEDSAACIINETAAQMIGLEDPVGKRLVNPFSKSTEKNTHEIIGVVSDFHFQPLENPIGGLILFLIHGNPEGYLTVKINPAAKGQTIEFLKTEWEKFTQAYPFVYFFLDNHLKEYYLDLQKTARIFLVLSVVAVFIACLGLFGLISYTTSQRIREIGIRKAMGASVFKILLLQLKETALLIIFSSAVAWGLGFFMARSWLQDFYYRVSISPAYFLLASIMVLIIAIVSVSHQTIMAAKINPGQAIKYE